MSSLPGSQHIVPALHGGATERTETPKCAHRRGEVMNPDPARLRSKTCNENVIQLGKWAGGGGVNHTTVPLNKMKLQTIKPET